MLGVYPSTFRLAHQNLSFECAGTHKNLWKSSWFVA
jgi:hypothetical protein